MRTDEEIERLQQLSAGTNKPCDLILFPAYSRDEAGKRVGYPGTDLARLIQGRRNLRGYEFDVFEFAREYDSHLKSREFSDSEKHPDFFLALVAAKIYKPGSFIPVITDFDVNLLEEVIASAESHFAERLLQWATENAGKEESEKEPEPRMPIIVICLEVLDFHTVKVQESDTSDIRFIEHEGCIDDAMQGAFNLNPKPKLEEPK